MSNELPDIDAYIGQLLDETYDEVDPTPDPALWVSPDIDVDTLSHLPALTWSLLGDGQVANGPGMWSFVLSVNIFGNGMDEAKAATRLVHSLIWAWDEDPFSSALVVDGMRLNIAGVEDIDLPTRVAESIIVGRNVVQYAGRYSLLIRG